MVGEIHPHEAVSKANGNLVREELTSPQCRLHGQQRVRGDHKVHVEVRDKVHGEVRGDHKVHVEVRDKVHGEVRGGHKVHGEVHGEGESRRASIDQSLVICFK